MATKKSKPKGAKLGASVRNLTASFPWLKNKTFLIPAVAFVLVLSTVGVVSAVQGGVFSPAGPGTADTSLEDTEAEAAIGFACVAGTEICEEVKSILLNTDYDEVVTKWTRESLIAYLEYKYGRSRAFATEVVDAVKFDWGDGSRVGACVSGELICDQARYVLITTDQGKQFTREEFISTWMEWYGGTREKVEAIIDELGFTDWAGAASARGSAPSRGPTSTPSNQQETALPPALLPQAPVSPTAQVSADQGQSINERARELLNLWGETYGPSRLRVIDDMVRLFGFGREESTVAVDSLNADWNTQAFRAARNYANQAGLSKLSKKGIENILVERQFTQAEAEYAMNTLDYNWLGNAVRAAEWMLLDDYFGCDYFVWEYVDDDGVVQREPDFHLVDWLVGTFEFTIEEAWYAAESQVAEPEAGYPWKPIPYCP